jgi:hypothetical protein
MKKKKKLGKGQVWGLAFAVLFLVAASVRADDIREMQSAPNTNDVKVECFTFMNDSTVEDNGEAA